MPRGLRLDVPGTLHYLMIRRIKQDNIFLDDDSVSTIGKPKRRTSFVEKSIG
jgi:hypothetical protein